MLWCEKKFKNLMQMKAKISITVPALLSSFCGINMGRGGKGNQKVPMFM